MKTQMVHARIDPKLKKSAERIFAEIGISTAEAIPNAKTVAAMKAASRPAALKRYRSFRGLHAPICGS